MVRLTERESALLTAAAMADAAVLLWSGSATVATFGFIALGLPLGVVAALFLRGRPMAAVLAFEALLVFAARLRSTGGLGATVAAVFWLMGTGSVAGAVLLLVRTVQRQGRTDSDTGLPNGFGLAQLVQNQTDWSSYVVASMSLEGIRDAREALGYRTGTELVRRAVASTRRAAPRPSSSPIR
jgi:hypothetical protein